MQTKQPTKFLSLLLVLLVMLCPSIALAASYDYGQTEWDALIANPGMLADGDVINLTEDVSGDFSYDVISQPISLTINGNGNTINGTLTFNSDSILTINDLNVIGGTYGMGFVSTNTLIVKGDCTVTGGDDRSAIHASDGLTIQLDDGASLTATGGQYTSTGAGSGIQNNAGELKLDVGNGTLIATGGAGSSSGAGIASTQDEIIMIIASSGSLTATGGASYNTGGNGINVSDNGTLEIDCDGRFTASGGELKSSFGESGSGIDMGSDSSLVFRGNPTAVTIESGAAGDAGMMRYAIRVDSSNPPTLTSNVPGLSLTADSSTHIGLLAAPISPPSTDTLGSSPYISYPAPVISGVIATPTANGAALSVSASVGNASNGERAELTYQWYYWNDLTKLWVAIPGATGTSFDYTGLTDGQEYTVRVRVGNHGSYYTFSQSVSFTAAAKQTLALPNQPTAAQAPAYPAQGKVSANNVNVRPAANTKGKTLDKLQKNDGIKVLGYENGFFKVEWKNGVAYVSADYVDVAFAAPVQGSATANMTAYTQRIASGKYQATKVKKGDALNLLSHDGQWWKAQLGDNVVYLKTNKIALK